MFAGEGVDEGGLAGVALADDGDLHVDLWLWVALVFWDEVVEFVEHVAAEVFGGCRADEWGVESEGGEFVGVGFPARVVAFGGDDIDGGEFGVFVAFFVTAAELLFAEHLGDGLVLGGDAGLAIDGEEDDVCGGDGLGDLVLDVVGESGEVGADFVIAGAVGDINTESAGVSQFDLFGGAFFVEGVLGVDQIDDDREAVAGDAWGVVNDGDALLGDEIEEGGLADIWSAHDGDAGDGHSRG